MTQAKTPHVARNAAWVASILLFLPLASIVGGVSASNPFARGAAVERVLVVAHAGASSIAPQNTLVAGQAALALGADVWGVDVRVTRDGRLVLMHDETLDRTTNVEDVFPDRAPWRVADFTLDEVRRLDAGSWFAEIDPFGEIASGIVSPEEADDFAGEPVPTLKEALEFVAAADWLIDVEVKSLRAEDRGPVAARLSELIAATGTEEQVFVSSFDHDFLRTFRAVAPSVPIGVLALLPPSGLVEFLDSIEADVYLPSVVGFTPPLLEDLEQTGFHVILWTYNTIDSLEYALGLPGIDGVYTDFPQRLLPLLRPRAVEDAP
jgi:glycerophosphoryl diester phosphodiesterase